MGNYITENGKIFWDRAEPFIRLLGQHENEVFIDRLKQIDSRKERVVSYHSDFSKVMSTKSNTEIL
jgi:5'-3' exonuclease